MVNILNRLADQLPLKSPPSNIIQINFISLSGINCTCLSVDTSLSEVLFLKQSNLYCPYCFGENLIVLFIWPRARSLTCPSNFIINSQGYCSTCLCNTKAQDFQIDFYLHSSCMGVSSKSYRISWIYHCTYSAISFWVKTGMLLSS